MKTDPRVFQKARVRGVVRVIVCLDVTRKARRAPRPARSAGSKGAAAKGQAFGSCESCQFRDQRAMKLERLVESPTPCHLSLTLEIFPQMDKLPHRVILLPTLIVVGLTILSEGYIDNGHAINHTT